MTFLQEPRQPKCYRLDIFHQRFSLAILSFNSRAQMVGDSLVGNCRTVVEHLPTMHEALGSMPSTGR